MVGRQKRMKEELGRYVGLNEVLEYVVALRNDGDEKRELIREAKKRLGMSKAAKCAQRAPHS
jgi:hypothetical protein